ncbi:zinc finger protein isoform X1 [Ciona intestinalis]
MGNCYRKQRTPLQRLGTRPTELDDEDGPYMLVINNNNGATGSSNNPSHSRWDNLRNRASRRNRDTQPTWSLCRLTDEELDKHVIDTLSTLRNSAENDTTLILRMRMFRFWANGETGWNMVLLSLIRAVPLDNALGPSAITLFIDHCPLPTKQGVMKLINDLNLSWEKAADEFMHGRNTDKCARHRNVCAVLGHLAESLAGPLSATMLTQNTLEYFMCGLEQTINGVHIPVVNILYSLIALEKFAQTGTNKDKINATEIRAKLMALEDWTESSDYKKCQVGFSARWLLDNAFIVKGRPLSYESVSLNNINAMLNHNDVSEYLKLSADGLEARSDASSLESVRCTYCVNSGVWYYEVTIITPGVMQIGWATKKSKFFNYDGYGIGDDEYSCAYDGCRQLYWHQAQSRRHIHPAWREGDILGLLLDLEKNQVIFYLNGDPLPSEGGIFNHAKEGFFAAASFMSHQQCIFNFGAKPFKFPPLDREYSCFNDHATLTAEEKLILPKHKKLELIKLSEFTADQCDLCCDLKANTTILPCNHRTNICVKKLHPGTDATNVFGGKSLSNPFPNCRLNTAAMPLAIDILHPSPEEEKRRHKKKRLVQSPNSYFMDVKCPGCYKITTVFSHAQTVVLCVGCSTVLCQPTGGRARLTEGCSFRRKQH